ncbi:hypothetical protein QTH90_16255 [Variovorax sp. J2P1-59]|uniref:hypothetical protein n=1 Tax=Variovorax flavidus TaxID=3053501 RepID=UPI002576F1BE|nr:hypothetical protein [Variovorax sp. J2P1-59]MDM0075958.1 hypothetical protein [Variovorax sp. J2P1-59]
MTPIPASAATAGLPSGEGPVADGRAVLELHVAELRQLFNSMDPAPFRERDLDPKAQDYIVDWAREVQASRPLALVVRIDSHTATPEAASMLRDAVGEYFRQRALATRRQMRRLLRLGRISLLIGLVFLAIAFFVGEFIAGLFDKERYTRLVQESLVIGGWVALWRPMEIFLYDWWPIREEMRLYERLSRMDVHLVCAGAEGASS